VSLRDGSPALLEVRGLAKRYDGVVALAGANLTVRAGTVHCLLGENGAGKSTLIKCLAGVVTPDAGDVRVDGQPVALQSVDEAEAAGLRFIHQELNLVPQFDAVENCFVGRRYPRRGPFIDLRAMRARIEETARLLAPELPLDVPVARFTTGQRQLVEIIRALFDRSARLIVMDEPTAALSDGEAERLHRAVRALTAAGVAVIFISHRLDEVMALGDAYTVLRGGQTVGAGDLSTINRAGLVRLMSGHDVSEPKAGGGGQGGTVLSIRDLPFGRRGHQLTLDVAAGEIVGLYGLVGAGRSSLLQMIWGARPLEGGTIHLDGSSLAARDIAGRIRAGAAYVPEDRRAQGLMTTRSIAENLAIATLKDVRHAPALPTTSRSRMAARALAIRDRLGIRMASPSALPLTLSGGNQQKLLFGRWAGPKQRLMLLDEPTRGVDVGAKAEIHQIIRQTAQGGAAVLMATSDMDELLALSDRVLVFAHGEVTAELAGDDIRASAIVAAAFHHSDRPAETGQ
jgi:ABC-type sugar transport system ATPase subunit